MPAHHFAEIANHAVKPDVGQSGIFVWIQTHSKGFSTPFLTEAQVWEGTDYGCGACSNHGS